MDFTAARANMVESQVRTNDVTEADLLAAMRTVARERFCAPARAFSAYSEVEAEIAPGRALMRPRDIGKLLQLARPRAGETALAIAAPYAAALLEVMGLKTTAQEADGRAAAVLAPALEAHGVTLATAPFAEPALSGVDLIVCEAALAEVPEAWFAALAPGGRLAAVERRGPLGKARLWLRTASGVSPREGFDSTPPFLPGFEPVEVFQF